MEIDNNIYYRFKEVHKTRRIRNNNKRRISPNHNQYTYLEEESATTCIEIGGNGCTMTGDTVSVFIDGMFTLI